MLNNKRVVVLCLSFACFFGSGFPVYAHEASDNQMDKNENTVENDTDFNIINGILISYNGNDEVVTVPDSVKRIGENVFYSNKAIKKVILPSSLESIESSAFALCSNLTEINLPQSLKTIGERAFEYCENLTDIELPSLLKTIESHTFYNTNIKNLTISTTVKEINASAFGACNNLEEVVFQGPGSISIFSAFSNCPNLKRFEFLDKDAYCGLYGSVFSGDTNLESVILPNRAFLYSDADIFKNCFRLNEINLPSTVSDLADELFIYQTNLTIYGYTNSYVEQYAKNHNIHFKSLGLAANSLDILNVSDLVDYYDKDYAGYFTVKVGEKYKLDLKVGPDEHQDTPWFKYWNPEYIDVDRNGVVTGIKAGTTLVDIYINNIHKMVKITVVDEYPIHTSNVCLRFDNCLYQSDKDFELRNDSYDLIVHNDVRSLTYPLTFSYEGPPGLKYNIEGNIIKLENISKGKYVFKIKQRDGSTSEFKAHFKALAKDFNCPEEIYMPIDEDEVNIDVSLNSEDEYGYFKWNHPDIHGVFTYANINGGYYCLRNEGSNKPIGGVSEITFDMYDDAMYTNLVASKKVKVIVDGWTENLDGYYKKGNLVKNSFVGDSYFDKNGKLVLNEWVYDNLGTLYKLGDGTYVKSRLIKINDYTYYFDESGHMSIGWQKVSGDWYYFEGSGIMASNKWVGNYYLDSDGKMATNKWIGNYYVGSNGLWVQNKPLWDWVLKDGAWSYQNAKTKELKKNEWVQSGSWYYFDENGIMVTGLHKIKNVTYFFDASGAMETGWQQINSKWYYFNKEGYMVKNQWINNYYFEADGVMATNKWIGNYYVDSNGLYTPDQWVLTNGKYWYRHQDGSYTKNDFEEIAGQTYYFDANGYMFNGWKQIGSDWYYFGQGGIMAKNQWIGNYYFESDGKMATNKWIGNYFVGSDGIWCKDKVR